MTIALLLAIAAAATACESSAKQLLAVSQEQAKLRAMQTRSFDTGDEQVVLRSVMDTMQDLGFAVTEANAALGLVSGGRRASYFEAPLQMTVTVRRSGESQVLVRAAAQYGQRAVEDPEAYNEFFHSLSKALFLAAHEIE